MNEFGVQNIASKILLQTSVTLSKWKNAEEHTNRSSNGLLLGKSTKIYMRHVSDSVTDFDNTFRSMLMKRSALKRFSYLLGQGNQSSQTKNACHGAKQRVIVRRGLLCSHIVVSPGKNPLAFVGRLPAWQQQGDTVAHSICPTPSHF